MAVPDKIARAYRRFAFAGLGIVGERRERMSSVQTTTVIRSGTPADYPAVAGVFRRASLFNDGDREDLLACPQHLVLGPEGLELGRTLVAEVRGSVVGFSSWRESDDGTVDLEDLFVDPTWMRRGIATALVVRLIAVLRARGVSSLEVTANPHALGFYQAGGFGDIGTTRTEFGTAPRMALRIN